MSKTTIPIFLNRQKHDIPKDVSYAQFRNILEITVGRPLYLRDGRSFVEVTDENFLLRQGQHYFDVPDWIEGETEKSLPPILLSDIEEIGRIHGNENINICSIDNNHWEISISNFPTLPHLQKKFGIGVLKIIVNSTYPQSSITGIQFNSPLQNINQSCYSCSNWNPQRDGINSYLCAIQKWMEVK
ncbi:MAG: hypothetical protein KGZ63_11490 [Clostridiales bacterium]|jgi:hypothetical protein|nr:hypothetical protein [Clostridiales bacterium]